MIIDGEKVIFSFNAAMEAAYVAEAGSALTVKTHDCFYQHMLEEGSCISTFEMDSANPATGPIYVEGAEVGDILKVSIEDIEVADRGVAMVIPGAGFLADQNVEETKLIIPIEDGKAHLLGLELPIRPMIGVIGVAPEEGDSYPTNTPWNHGGNMDTKDITAGTTLYFPVRQDGALLALGDAHALMGDGEVGVTGLEIQATVKLKLDVIKDKNLAWPMLETEEATMLLVSGDDVEDALRKGLEHTLPLLQKGLDLSWNKATILASLALDAKISQLVDPKITVRYPIPKSILSTERILEIL